MLLDAPSCPEGCEALWNIFCELHACRGEGRISYVDVDAYQRVTGVVLRPWELAAIRRADNAFLETRNRD